MDEQGNPASESCKPYPLLPFMSLPLFVRSKLESCITKKGISTVTAVRARNIQCSLLKLLRV